MAPTLDGRNYSRAELERLWQAVYVNREQQLGATPSLVPFGDRYRAGAVSATTFTGEMFSATGLSPTWTTRQNTTAAALSAWATPFDLTLASNYAGIVPALTFTPGSSENMTTPDADYWTRIETAAFSIGLWIRPNDITSVTLLSKWDLTTGAEAREWQLQINSSSKLALHLFDESAAMTDVSRPSSTSIVANQWQFVVVTYTGDGGADAADSINLYINGALDNGTAVNDALYAAMENLGTQVQLGAHEAAGGTYTQFYGGPMAGGPFGPFFAQAELSLAQIQNMYECERPYFRS